jgi:hypothetical protein
MRLREICTATKTRNVNGAPGGAIFCVEKGPTLGDRGDVWAGPDTP